MLVTDASSSSTLVQHSKDIGSQSFKFVPNGLLGISGTTATANEEVEAQVPSSSMLKGLILCSQLTYFHSIASKGLSFVSNGLLSSRPSESNPDVGQFCLFLMSHYCPANALPVLPRADSPYPTISNTQSLLDDDPPPVSGSSSSSSSMLIESLILCSQLTYFDSISIERSFFC